MSVVYDYLSNHPELTNTLGEAIYYQWEEMYRNQGKSVEDVVETVRARAVSNTIPLTMVAVECGVLLGSVTIKENDFADHPELTPWIAGVFVLPEQRGRGIGKGLVLHAEKIASEQFGVEESYLYTGSASGLYSQLGYETFETVNRGEKVLTLMKKKLS